MGPHKTRSLFAMLQLLSMALFAMLGHSVWLLVIPITLMHLAGPVIDLTGPHVGPKPGPRNSHPANDHLYCAYVYWRWFCKLGGHGGL